MAELECPKCQSAMRSYERSGITVDQCTGCRGVFLDRGELERLVDMEGNFYEQRVRGGGEHQREERHEERYERPSERFEPRYGGHKPHGYGHKRHKREGLLGELFDF